MKLETYIKIVDRAIEKMGISLKDYKVAENQWVYIKGSAFTLVEVGSYTHDGKERGYIQAFAPICQMPEENTTDFLLEVMKLNHGMRGTFFALHRDIVVMKMVRDVVGLDDSEVQKMITYIGRMADKLDNPLKKVHGGADVDVNLSLMTEIAQAAPVAL
ncbi:MAG: YbjN domain-containing protein [Bacteroidetes bacterium]|jgi:hypothetical protein|nr:YbjN domain-containing protein [Bacteroidota bacterium]